MLNMNLEWNGSYIVAAAIYDAIYHRFGHKYLISTQALHWKSVCRMYRLKTVKAHQTGPYKLTISAILDAAQSETICSERDFSIYTDPPCVNDELLLDDIPTKQEGVCYKMSYRYMPNACRLIQDAIQTDRLVVANIVLFTNFLQCNRGIIMAPTDADSAVGMLACMILGYDTENWIIRFPLGMHWGDGGVGYVSFEYFERFSRDRWVIDIEQFRQAENGDNSDTSTASRMFQPLTTNSTAASAYPSDRSKKSDSTRRRHMF